MWQIWDRETLKCSNLPHICNFGHLKINPKSITIVGCWFQTITLTINNIIQSNTMGSYQGQDMIKLILKCEADYYTLTFPHK